MSQRENTSEAGHSPADAVRRYYRLVDEGDIDGLVQLFDTTAEYLRPGYEKLTGHEELTRFYREERVIESGRHSVSKLVHDGQDVAVHGVFEGKLRDGTHTSLRFADFFQLTPSGTFSRRETFFFAPMV
ncbi:nuclear transport factor 2 family protein [Streptomyces sp. NPDC057697]|uniref:nuclear transport factor 2 family protein n=1 Tax=Streptomyces sp. NPDC057697 TaxID=3346219 RepID=UPI0036B3F8D6